MKNIPLFERVIMVILISITIFAVFVAYTAPENPTVLVNQQSDSQQSQRINYDEIKPDLFVGNTEALDIQPITTDFNISGCQKIQSNHYYRMTRDIVIDKNPCFEGYLVNSIIFDCQGHHLIANSRFKQDINESVIYPYIFDIDSSNEFVIQNCNIDWMFDGKNTREGGDLLDEDDIPLIKIQNSHEGTFRNNIIQGKLSLHESGEIEIKNNFFLNSDISLYMSRLITIKDNGFVFKHRWLPTAGDQIYILDGESIVIKNNKFWGGHTGGINNYSGVDDAVVIDRGSNNDISNNEMSDFWDCGFEGAGLITNTKISHNLITNTGVCGIGGWYLNSWENNNVLSNTVTDSPLLFLFYRVYGSYTDDKKSESFSGNNFDGNVLLNKRAVSRSAFGHSSVFTYNHDSSKVLSQLPEIYFNKAIYPVSLSAQNNIFTNNDFGVNGYIYFNPKDMFVDGGNNKWIVCTPNTKDCPTMKL